MSKKDSAHDGYGLQSPAALKTRKRLAGEAENAFEQLVAKTEREPDEAVDDQPPAPPRRRKIDSHGHEILYEAGDRLAQPDAWPCVVNPEAEENGHHETSLDGDSAVVLVDVVNLLQQHIGEQHAFTDTRPGGAAIVDEKRIPHLLRLIVRAAGPLLVAHIESGLDESAKAELRKLVGATLRGTSAVREAAERARVQREIEREKERAEAERQVKLRQRAEAAVAADEAAAHAARIEEKLAAISST